MFFFFDLLYKFNCSVPHELTQTDKDRCVRACSNLLEYQSQDKILDQIVTYDEKWIYFNNTSQKLGWSVPGQPIGSVAKRNLTSKKIMQCIWWDIRGIIHKEYLQKYKTLDSKVYSEMLVHIDAAIKEKHQGECRHKMVMFHEDNARPHMSAFIGWTLYGLNGIFCHTHHVAPISLVRTSTFFHTCSYILLVLSSFLHRTSERKFIYFWTRGHQVFGSKILRNCQNIGKK